MKKIICLISSFAIMLGISIPASATSISATTHPIPFETYYSVLQEEFLKKGVQYTVTEYDPNYIFTQEALDETVAKIRSCDSVFTVTVTDEFEQSNMGRSMPVDYSISRQTDVYANDIFLPGEVHYVTHIWGVYDAQNNYVIEMYYENQKTGYSINVTGEDLGLEVFYENPGGRICAGMDGTVTFEYTDPWTAIHQVFTQRVAWGTNYYPPYN